MASPNFDWYEILTPLRIGVELKYIRASNRPPATNLRPPTKWES